MQHHGPRTGPGNLPGTGAFKDATGTITAKPISSTKTVVTITYSG